MSTEKKNSFHVQYRGGFSDRNGIDRLNTNIQITEFDERTRTFFINELQTILNTIEGEKKDEWSFDFDFESLADFAFTEIYQMEISHNTGLPKTFSAYYWAKKIDIFFEIVNKTIRNDTYDKVLTVIEAILQWTKKNFQPRRYAWIYSDNPNQYSPYDETKEFNRIFEKEFVGYRFINNIITPITDKIEIKEIETGLDIKFGGCRSHIHKALAFLSDRETPDYKNSIKESISAVEAICKIIVGDENSELNKALKKLKEKGLNIHPALEQAWNKLYAYTCDEGGVRHSEKAFESNVTFEEAKYMLVSCCAFVNYLIAEYGKIK